MRKQAQGGEVLYPSSSYQSLMKLGLEKKWCPAFRGGHLQPEPVPAHRHSASSLPFLACLVVFCPSVLLLFLLATTALQWFVCVCVCVRARAHTLGFGVFFFVLFFLLDVCYFWKAL